MTVTEAARRRLSALRERCGQGCLGFRFRGALGSCLGSTPLLEPVAAPVPGCREFRDGDVVLFASGEAADILAEATLDADDGVLFGRGLVLSWPHREGGCPNCR